MKQIPNLFTLLNLVAGCIAIVLILQTGSHILVQTPQGTWVPQLSEPIWWGAICIGIAAVIDFLDGFVARLFNATSDMGKQLDSLADIVSFGVAPGLILYQLLRISFAQQPDALDISVWALAPAALFPCAGAWRLARFNVAGGSSSYFTGVPIPAAGLVAASLPLILFYDDGALSGFLLNAAVIYAVIILLSLLMVSRTKFMALKFADRSAKSNWPKLLLLIIAAIAALLVHWAAVPIVFIAYIIISIATKNQLK